MRFSLVHQVPLSRALSADFVRTYQFALLNKRVLSRDEDNGEAEMHFFHAWFLFQCHRNGEANKELEVNHLQLQHCQPFMRRSTDLSRISSVLCQLALSAGDATWRRLPHVHWLTTSRYTADLTGALLNSAHASAPLSADTVEVRPGDDMASILQHLRPGAPGVQWIPQLLNESGADAIKRYCAITGENPPGRLLSVPVRTSSQLRIGDQSFDLAADSLPLNSEEHKRHRQEERAAPAMVSVQLFALGFNTDAAYETELRTGACARLSQMADAFVGQANALPVHRASRLADVLPVLLVNPSRSVWIVAHGSHDGSFGL